MSAPPERGPTTPAAPPARHPDAPAPGEKIPSHYDDCFGCGARHPTGLHLALRAGEGVSVTGEFEVTVDHQGAPGLAHGGLLSCALDEVLGTLVWLLRTPAVTGRLETDFRAPVPVGARLHLHALATGVDGRKIFAGATGRLGADGPVAVQATAIFVQVPLDHFTQHGRPAELARAADDPTVRRSARAFDVNP